MERQRHDRFAALFVRNQNRVYRYLPLATLRGDSLLPHRLKGR